jgi:hypothetical protein
LIVGPLRAGRLRPTARLSAPRSNPLAMRMQTNAGLPNAPRSI